MADENFKKYLDQSGVEALVSQIKTRDAAVKGYVDESFNLADGQAASYAATALENAKDYTDTEVAKASAAAAAADSKAVAAGTAAAAAQSTADNAVTAAGVADGKAVAAQEAVEELAEFVGELPEGSTATSVIGYINDKTSGIATDTALAELQGRVKAIEDDHLDATDKTEIEGKITAVQGLVTAEQSRAEGIEAGLESRLAAVEGDYLKAEDKSELQGKIDAVNDAVELLTEGVDAEKVDGVKDLIAYVEEHGTEVTGIKSDISANAGAIEGLAGRMDTAEDEIDALQEAIDTKVAQSVYEAKISALEGADSGFNTRIAALEAKHGEGEDTVESLIESAKQEAINTAAGDATEKANKALEDAKKYADDEDAKIEARVLELEAAADDYALAADLTALEGRVTIAEGEIDTLQSEMDAVEAKAAANEAAHKANTDAIKLLAAQSALDAAVKRITDNEAAIAQNTADIAAFRPITGDDVNAMFAQTA